MEDELITTLSNMLINDNLQRNRGDITRAKFLKYKKQIIELRNQGFSRKTIWSYLKANGYLFCEYVQFTRLFNRYIIKANEQITQRKTTTNCSKNFNFSAKGDSSLL